MGLRTIPAVDASPGRARAVVAAVLTHRGRVCLLRRSREVTGDVGRWHCVTGYLPAREDPLRQALLEVWEEVGLRPPDLELHNAAVVDLRGADGTDWRVHAFQFHSRTSVVRLNWEHDAVQWVHLGQPCSLPTVAWLGDVVHALSDTPWPSTFCRTSRTQPQPSVSG